MNEERVKKLRAAVTELLACRMATEYMDLPAEEQKKFQDSKGVLLASDYSAFIDALFRIPVKLIKTKNGDVVHTIKY